MTPIARRLILTLCLSAGLHPSVDPAWAQSLEKGSMATDWSSFRGPTGQGIAEVDDLPLQWSATDNIAWKAEMPGPGASSPVVFDQHIYVTAYSGFFVPGKPGGTQKDLKRHLLCFDSRSGKQLWEQVVPARLPEEESIRDHGFAASTPAVDQDHVYCFFGKTGVFALDHTGKQIWQTDVGSKTHGWGSAASPVLHEDLVIINASVESESLVALDRASGKVVWKADNIKEAWNTPAVVRNPNGQQELVVATQGQIRSFEPLTGKSLWTCATDITWYMVPSLVANDGIVYSLGGRSGVAALAVQTGGSGDVTQTHRLWTGQRGSNVTSPVFHDGHLYFMNDNREIAYCLDAETGEAVYEKRINRSGQIYASALLAGDRIYYLSRDGRTFVVAADPEFKELATNDLRDGSLFNGSFAVDGSRLLVRSDRYLYAIGK
jgi:outer membrane protein assembly factor BamB